MGTDLAPPRGTQDLLPDRADAFHAFISANNRRARFYRLTSAGRKQLGVEESRFSQMFGAIMRVMKTT